MAKERFDFIDIAKCIGIVLVVCSHSMYSDMMYAFNGCFVPLFFVASGYVSPRKVDMAIKAKRLLKPYFIFSLAIVALVLLSGLRDITINNISGIFYSRYSIFREGVDGNVVLMNIGNAPLWFLTSMFLAFVAFRALVGVERKSSRIVMIAVYLLVTYLFSRQPILLPWSLDTAFLMAIFIYAGYLLRHELGGVLKSWWSVLLLGGVYIVCMLINGYTNLSVGNMGKSIILALVCGIAGSVVLIKCSMLLEHVGALKKAFVEIGKHSLTIFCIHMPLLSVLGLIYARVLGNALTIPELICGALLQIAISIVAGYIISKVLYRFAPWVLK